jgi:hypothetical protein
MEHWKTLDISEMTEEWVQSTDDFLFCKLHWKQRYMLQLVFVKEHTWEEIGKILLVDPDTAHGEFNEIMTYLDGRAKLRSKTPK